MAKYEMTYPTPVTFSDVDLVNPGDILDFDEAPSATWWTPVEPAAPITDTAPTDPAPTDPAPAA